MSRQSNRIFDRRITTLLEGYHYIDFIIAKTSYRIDDCTDFFRYGLSGRSFILDKCRFALPP